jgi:hypothetical protein
MSLDLRKLSFVFLQANELRFFTPKFQNPEISAKKAEMRMIIIPINPQNYCPTRVVQF